MSKSSSLLIDLKVIQDNIRELACHHHVMVMVKGNAYGTDPIYLSKFIQKYQFPQVPFLGVSYVGEGVQLRESGIHMPIFVISAPPESAHLAVLHQLTPAVSSFEEAAALNEAGKKFGKAVPVHLFLNTGMNRFGIAPNEAFSLYQWIMQAPFLIFEGLLTHFAAAEQKEFDAFSERQIFLFKKFLNSLPTPPRWVHAANSAGSARFSLPFCNLGRLGLCVVGYGVRPKNVKPALKLTTSLSYAAKCKKGDTIGYNRTFKMVSEKGRVGVIPFGYYDGFPRSLSGKGYVLIGSKKIPMIGSVCMDFTMIDLTSAPEAKPGDPVTIIDHELTPENLAEWSGTDVREILVRLSPRVERVWINPPIIMENINGNTSSERLPSSLLSL